MEQKDKKLSKVFISYAKEDTDIAKILYNDLNSCGVQTWIDCENLLPGQNWKITIEKAIKECSYFIALLSSNSVSKTGFIQNELKISLDILSSIPPNKIFVIPVRVDECIPSDDRLKYIHWADLFPLYEKGFKKLLQVLAFDDDLHIDNEGFKNRNENSTQRLVVGISGPSCSGKTWLAKKFTQIRPNSVSLFDLDSYYKNIEYVSQLEHKHDNPNAINFDDALCDLILLKNGNEVTIPTYNFETHKKYGDRVCKPAQLIIVEGLFIFANERLRREIDIKIWVDTGEGLRYQRRINRDTIERGRDFEEVLKRYDDDVLPGYQKFVLPLRSYADVIFENNGRDKDWHPLILDILLSYVDTISYRMKKCIDA